MHTLDMRGYQSPLPLLRAKSMFVRLKPNEVLEVVVTDPTCKKVIPQWVNNIGHKLVEIKEEIVNNETIFRIRIKKVRE